MENIQEFITQTKIELTPAVYTTAASLFLFVQLIKPALSKIENYIPIVMLPAALIILFATNNVWTLQAVGQQIQPSIFATALAVWGYKVFTANKVTTPTA